VIDQGGELRSLVPERDELSVLSVNRVTQACRSAGLSLPLVFAQRAE
jgi:hypothetical protein